MISLIFAMDKNGVLGKDNQMPWHLPVDLAYFKEVTYGSSVVMGRKTFDSIGKPLPNRKNIVLTRDKFYKAEGTIIVNTLEEALAEIETEEETFIIGGAEIYSIFLPLADKLYITKIHHAFEGDTFFPEIDYNKWTLISKTIGEKDEENPYHYSFEVYQRAIPF